MKLRLPSRLSRLIDASEDLLNIQLIARFDVRVVDVLMVIGFLWCVLYYYFATGWMGALQGGFLYVLVGMTALYVLRGPQ